MTILIPADFNICEGGDISWCPCNILMWVFIYIKFTLHAVKEDTIVFIAKN